MKNFYKLLFAMFIVLTLSACSSSNINYDYISENSTFNTLSGDITISGSTSMTKLVNALGEAFSNIHSDVNVEKSDTGSSAAVNSVINGIALIGDLSRELNENESPEKLHQVVIAFDGIALIVNNKNPINNLSSNEVHNIFSGNITKWSELGGNDDSITIIGREESSGTRESFEKIFNPEGVPYHYHAEYPESGDILSKVSSDESAIGYISISSLSDSIKAISIDGTAPTEENVMNNTYILKRPFIEVVLKNNDSILIKRWFEFINSDSGKSIIRNMKLIPTNLNAK